MGTKPVTQGLWETSSLQTYTQLQPGLGLELEASEKPTPGTPHPMTIPLILSSCDTHTHALVHPACTFIILEPTPPSPTPALPLPLLLAMPQPWQLETDTQASDLGSLLAPEAFGGLCGALPETDAGTWRLLALTWVPGARLGSLSRTQSRLGSGTFSLIKKTQPIFQHSCLLLSQNLHLIC